MTATIRHYYVDQQLVANDHVGPGVTVTTDGNFAVVHAHASGTLSIRHPGRLDRSGTARYEVHIPGVGPIGGGGTGPPHVDHRSMNLTVEILTPNGELFSADHVTLDDLARFRDLRGATQGTWSYRAFRDSEPIPAGPDIGDVRAGDGFVWISLDETLASQSAPALVSSTVDLRTPHSFGFDLYRVGTFVAALGSHAGGSPTLRLHDPDGAVVAESTTGQLSCLITLAMLGKSRDAQGQPRAWSLEVRPTLGAIAGTASVSATVVGATRIALPVLQDRIEKLLGPHGSFLRIAGELQGSDALARLTILDQITAETIDMHDLLDDTIKSVEQDPGVVVNDEVDVDAGVAYNLAKRTAAFRYELSISELAMTVTGIHVAIAESVHLQPPIPALQLEVQVAGHATFAFAGFPLATIAIRDGRIPLEVGVRVGPTGALTVDSWIESDRVDVDVAWEAALALHIFSVELIGLGAQGVTEYLESEINELIQQGFRTTMTGAVGRVQQILRTLQGAELSYRAIRLDGGALVFEYGAPIEPEPRPDPHHVPILGRTAVQLGPDAWRITPALGDTWAAPNLAAKIDHIVVVMMENRSFDHVLGYRAQLADGAGSDGLTSDLMQLAGFPIKPLAQQPIARNAFGLATAFPEAVGHDFADVAEQLGARLTLPSGRVINSPQGFVSNFAARLSSQATIPPEAVLGFYAGTDLAFFQYLADHYARGERYFSSHPGPTLPNRMMSLIGDIAHDRTGEAILDNNLGDDFTLSRAPTVFDLLTRRGVSWRVYESFPSVTMLRMFSRYAGDHSNIVDVTRFAGDVAAGNLPAVTFIDPAMHHFPQTDDHPIADMYNGQVFLQGIYDALRANPAAWQRTMLVITYDEHGGFYDHVVPPTAEARTRAPEATDGSSPGGGAVTPATLLTPYGVRVPLFVVSPWAPAGKGPDLVLDHCSIVKTILARFCAANPPFLSDRVNASRSLDAFLSEPAPRVVPSLPALPPLPLEGQGRRWPQTQIVTDPLSRAELRAGGVDFHVLTGMVARLLGR